MGDAIATFEKRSRETTTQHSNAHEGERIFRVDLPHELEKAGPNDLVRLMPVTGSPSIIMHKKDLAVIAAAIVNKEFLHLHGETGTGKTALIEALILVPGNWMALCHLLCVEPKPLRVHTIEMVNYETPGELYKRRAIRNGATYDEESDLVVGLRDLLKFTDDYYCAIWAREMGRVHSETVQGGLLNLITRGMLRMPNGESVCAAGIAWIADSNYHTNDAAVHTLVTQDDALARRWTVSKPFDYLSPEEEVRIVRHLKGIGEVPEVDDELIVKVVELGQAIRAQRGQGNLLSLAPPTLYGYFAFLRMASALPHLSVQDIAEVTILGAASPADREQVRGIFSDVFGLRVAGKEDSVAGGDLL